MVPERLGSKAFIVEHVEKLLTKDSIIGTMRNRLHAIINENYFSSFTRELSSGVVSELGYLAAPHRIPSYDRDLPYRSISEISRNKNLLRQIDAMRAEKLAAFGMSKEWIECLHLSMERHSKTIASDKKMEESAILNRLEAATIGIVTALPEEFAAVTEVFLCDDPISYPGFGSGRKYAMARLPSKSGTERIIAVCLLTDMGNDSAAIRATQLVQHCKNINHIVMVGIAGAVPNPNNVKAHVRLGDIVVSDRNGIVQYDMDKESPTETEIRNPPRPPGPALLEAARFLEAEELRNKRPWETYIDQAVHDWDLSGRGRVTTRIS
jgi:nucleoside phosphorylase